MLQDGEKLTEFRVPLLYCEEEGAQEVKLNLMIVRAVPAIVEKLWQQGYRVRNWKVQDFDTLSLVFADLSRARVILDGDF